MWRKRFFVGQVHYSGKEKVPLVKVKLKWTQRHSILHDTCLILVWLSQRLFFFLVFRIIFTEATYTEDFSCFYQSLQGIISIDVQNNRHMFKLFCKISNTVPLHLTCKWGSNSVNVPTNVHLVTKKKLWHFTFLFFSCKSNYWPLRRGLPLND